MGLGIDIIFRMKTIGTKKEPMMCELWLHIIQNYKKECYCCRVTKKGLISIFTSDEIKQRSSIGEWR